MIHRLSGRFSCKDSTLFSRLRHQHISVEVILPQVRPESLPDTLMLLVNTAIEQFRTCWNGAAALRLAHYLCLLWSFIRSGDKGVVTQLLREMPRNDWKAQHMLCAVFRGGRGGGTHYHCVCLLQGFQVGLCNVGSAGWCWVLGGYKLESAQWQRIISQLCHKSWFFLISTEGQRK